MKQDEEGNIIAFERGDVIWGVDPFKQDQVSDDDTKTSEDGGVAPRPWLIISNEAVPFHPDQYLCLTLTTRTWHEDSIPLSEDSWVEGGAPGDSSIMPWSISAIQHKFLDTTGELVSRLNSIPDEEVPDSGYQGHLNSEVTAEATRRVIAYLEDSLIT